MYFCVCRRSTPCLTAPHVQKPSDLSNVQNFLETLPGACGEKESVVGFHTSHHLKPCHFSEAFVSVE